jgi:hypothetical protein
MNKIGNISSFILVLLLVCGANTFKATRRFKFVNNCDKTIWVGGFGVPLPSITGWEMQAHT